MAASSPGAWQQHGWVVYGKMRWLKLISDGERAKDLVQLTATVRRLGGCVCDRKGAVPLPRGPSHFTTKPLIGALQSDPAFNWMLSWIKTAAK